MVIKEPSENVERSRQISIYYQNANQFTYKLSNLQHNFTFKAQALQTISRI